MSIKSISKKYNVRTSTVNYLIFLIDKHGYDILRTAQYEKQKAIDRVLINGEAKWAVCIDIGLPSIGLLCNWASKYKKAAIYEVGQTDGIAKRNIEIAKKMLKDNLDIKLISKYTDLSTKEIAKLQTKIDK